METELISGAYVRETNVTFPVTVLNDFGSDSIYYCNNIRKPLPDQTKGLLSPPPQGHVGICETDPSHAVAFQQPILRNILPPNLEDATVLMPSSP